MTNVGCVAVNEVRRVVLPDVALGHASGPSVVSAGPVAGAVVLAVDDFVLGCAGPLCPEAGADFDRLERGYAATTMDEIAARAGVAVQTVHYTFRTKGLLLREGLTAGRATDLVFALFGHSRTRITFRELHEQGAADAGRATRTYLRTLSSPYPTADPWWRRRQLTKQQANESAARR